MRGRRFSPRRDAKFAERGGRECLAEMQRSQRGEKISSHESARINTNKRRLLPPAFTKLRRCMPASLEARRRGEEQDEIAGTKSSLRLPPVPSMFSWRVKLKGA